MRLSWQQLVLATQCVDSEAPRSFENPQEYRINRNVVMGSLKEDVLKTLLKESSVEFFEKKFLKAANRAKIKVRPGLL